MFIVILFLFTNNKCIAITFSLNIEWFQVGMNVVGPHYLEPLTNKLSAIGLINDESDYHINHFKPSLHIHYTDVTYGHAVSNKR